MDYSKDATRHRPSTSVLSNLSYWLAAAAIVLAALGGAAQETTPLQTPDAQNQPQQPGPAVTITLPAGTQIPLALQRGLSTKINRPGDMAYLVTTAPVTSGDIVLIPPDTFVQGQISRISIPGVDRDGQLEIRSPQIVYANGYTVSIPYNLVVPIYRQWIYPEAPPPGRAFGLAAALAAPGVGALIGGLTSFHGSPPLPQLTLPAPGQPLPPLPQPHLGNPVKGAAIGFGIGAAVAIPVGIALLRHHREFFVEGGAPSDMILERPLDFEADRIATAATNNRTLAFDVMSQSPRVSPATEAPDCSLAYLYP